MKDFNLFMSQLSETNATLDSFTDFEKVSRNVAKISIKLNQLNYLLGKTDLRSAISDLFEENPKTFEALDILVAVRSSDNKKVLNDKYEPVLVQSYFTDIDSICKFVEEKGVKNGYVMWPIRTAVSGKQMTPGGATELMELLGKEESIARIRKGIELLSK